MVGLTIPERTALHHALRRNMLPGDQTDDMLARGTAVLLGPDTGFVGTDGAATELPVSKLGAMPLHY